MSKTPLLVASATFLVVAVAGRGAAAAPGWIGQYQEKKGTAFTTCTGTGLAARFTLAYEGELDGSAPAVGDVYPVLFSFENLGNCVADQGGRTSYGFDVRFLLPKRHAAIHDREYGDKVHRIQCFLHDPAGGRTEIVGETCARKIVTDIGWQTIETLDGYPRYKWVVPKGHRLDVIVPVIAADPVAKADGGFKAMVEFQMGALQGFDYLNLESPMVVASSPRLVADPEVSELTPTGAVLSADFFNRFTAIEGFFRLSPAPMFDGIRVFNANPLANNGRWQTYWGNLEPDTEYRWLAGIGLGSGDSTIISEEFTFRTPPMTGAKVVHATATGAPAAESPDLTRKLALQAGCSVGSPGGAGGAWLLLAALLLLLARRRPSRPAAILQRFLCCLLLPAAISMSGCESPHNSPPADPSGPAGGEGDPTSPTPAGGPGAGLSFSFVRAQPGLFTIPAGWQVNDKSLKAWQKDNDHVITLSPPGNPAVVLGLRNVLTTVRPARAIQMAAIDAEVVEVLQNKSGDGEGLYSRWLARVTLDGKPMVMGMFSWATLGTEGKRLVFLAALVAPTPAEFDLLGGIDTLRRLAYGQGTYLEGAPEVQVNGSYIGVEGTGGFINPYTGQTSDSGFGLSLTLTGNRISVLHYFQVSLGVGPTATSYSVVNARGTFVRYGGMIIPIWESCTSESLLNGTSSAKGPCPAGWGSALHMIPRSDGSFLVRMPGMETVGNIDEPGTVTVRPKT